LTICTTSSSSVAIRRRSSCACDVRRYNRRSDVLCSVCSESKQNLACSLFHLQGEQLAIHLQESLSSSSIRPADCISRASRSTAHHSTLSSLQHRHMHIWLHDLEIGRVDCRLSSHSQSALHRKATSVVFAFAKCPPPKGDFGFLTRGLHVVKSSLTDSGIFRSSSPVQSPVRCASTRRRLRLLDARPPRRQKLSD
jgi:hypothetical protein